MSEKPASDADRKTSPSAPPPTILPPANELERLESIVPGVGQRSVLDSAIEARVCRVLAVHGRASRFRAALTPSTSALGRWLRRWYITG